MTQRKTCKTCQFWEKEDSEQFAGYCRCADSSKYNWNMCNADTCEKHQPNNRQSEMGLE